jgi:hypothetical protein
MTRLESSRKSEFRYSSGNAAERHDPGGNSGLILATPSDPRTIGVIFRVRQ